MATYEDLVSVLNNPAGLSLADALDVRNQNVSLPTLAEKKSASVSQRLEEKQQRLNPNPPPQLSSANPFQQSNVLTSGPSQTGLADLAEASLYRAGGNLADAGRGISNKLFNTEFDDSEETGLSNSTLADEKAGVSLAYRQQLQQDQDQVLQDVAQGNWLDALGSTANVALRTAADSAATVPELAAGALLTPVAGAGTALLGRKIVKASETAKNIAERYDQIKDNKLVKGLNRGLEEAGKASVLTADIVQQQRNQYKAENNGEEPSAERLAGMTALTLATTIWQPEIAKRFFMPKVGKTTKKDGDFKTRMQKEVQSIVDKADRGVLNNLARRVGSGITGIAAAGGAEAVQEYAQFWAEALGTSMKPDEKTGFFQAAIDVFTEEGNADKAIQSAFLGAGAGAATKGALSTPGNAVGAVADTTLSTANAARRNIQQRVNEAMSDSDITAMSAEESAKQRAADKLKERKIAEADTINSAKTVNDIKDENTLNTLTTLAQGRDLNDADVFSAVKNTAIRKLKSEAAQAQVAATGKRVVGISKRGAEKLAEKSVELATKVLTPERIDEIKGLAVDTKKTIQSELENFPQSTTAGLIESAGEYASKKSKAGLRALREQAQASGIEATRKLADIINDDAPDVAKALRESAKKQENAAKQAGLRTDNLTTNDNLKTSIKAAAAVGVNKDSIDTTMADIFDVAKGEFDSQKTVDTVRAAIKRVRATDEFKALPNNEKVAFAALESNLRRKVGPASQTTTEKVKTTAKKVADNFELLKTKPGEASSTIKSAFKKVNDAFVKFTNSDETDMGQLLITDQREPSADTIPVKQDAANPDSEVVATIKKTPVIESLRQTFADSQAGMDEQNDSTGLDSILATFSNPEVVKQIANAINTDNPAVIQALFTHFAPSLGNPEYAAKLKDSLEAALNEEVQTKATTETETTSNETQPTEVSPTTKVKEEDQNRRAEFDKLSEKQVENLETVQVDEDTNILSGFENKTLQVQEEDGTFTMVAVPKTEDELKALLSQIPVCKE